MKKLLMGVTALFVVLGFFLVTTAGATVKVVGDIDKDKDKTVVEEVEIYKDVGIFVKQDAFPANSAEAQVVKNDENYGNRVEETAISGVIDGPGTQPAPFSVHVTSTASIDRNALNGSTGILGLNQAPGNMNNQGNATSLAFTTLGDAFLHAESSVEKINGGAPISWDTGLINGDKPIIILLPSNQVIATGSERTDVLDSAMTGISGIVGVNQAAGNINNQNNAAALSVGLNSIAAITEADLGLVNSNNHASETAVTKSDIISNGALGTFAGILGVNQSSGNMNNQANVVAASVLVSTDAVGRGLGF